MIVVIRVQHPPLRKRQLEDRVIGEPIPIDQLVEYVAADPKREYLCHDLHRLLQLGVQPLPVRGLMNVPYGEGTVAIGRGDTAHGRTPYDVRWKTGPTAGGPT